MKVVMTLDEYFSLRKRLQKEFDTHILPPHMFFLKVSPDWRLVRITAKSFDYLVTAKGPEGQESMAPITGNAIGAIIWFPQVKPENMDRDYAVVPQVNI